MKVCTTVTDLDGELSAVRNDGKSVGFVPTMGALHKGHISLINSALEQSDFVVCSIFVNPTQFNDASDFEQYPRLAEEDEKVLENAGCNLLFAPSIDEMYPGGSDDFKISIDLGALATVMEGEHRPGHFDGVVQVVNRLFEITRPDYAFFGEKDFQQLAVVREMVRILGHSMEIIGCPTVREPNGLAMSSRNKRLSKAGFNTAANISSVLMSLQQRSESYEDMEGWAIEQLKVMPEIDLEYVKIVDGRTLMEANANSETVVACAAAWLEGVRLIDNVTLRPN